MEDSWSRMEEKETASVMTSMQLTDRIVTKIKNNYYENEQFPFTSLSRNKLKKDEIQARH